MTEPISQETKWNALTTIVKRLPAQLTYYTSALGAIVLAGGGQLPPGLEFVAGGIGANLLSNLIDEVARGKTLPEDELSSHVEEAVQKSDIANLLTKQDFLQGYARLIQRLDAQKESTKDILTELQNGFSKVARADQVEELKTLILQIQAEKVTSSLSATSHSSKHLDVFISSTSRDLIPYRDAVAKVVLRLGMYPIDMATFNPTNRNALQLCYDKVQEAEVFVGIYAYRYGYAPGTDVTYSLSDGSVSAGDGETSITHLEYLWALERNLPMLLFVISDVDADGNALAWPVSFIEEDPGRTRLKSFKNMIMGKHVVGFFHSPDHLALQVAAGLSDIVTSLAYPDQESIRTQKQTNDQRFTFNNAPELPPNFVVRQQEMDQVTNKLLDDTGGGHVALTALRGMGGIGKSVLAAAICHTPRIQERFTDGVIWVSIGKDATNLVDQMRTIGQALGDHLSYYDSEVVARSRIAELLREKSILLVLDDVWQKEHVEPFMVSSPNSRTLFTTRDSGIALELDADEYRLGVLTTSQSVRLLKEWAKKDDSQFSLIAKKLGNLPLALKLAGARLREGMSGTQWLKTFDQVSKIKLGRRSNNPSDNLRVCFDLSIEQLEEDDQHLYHTLGIFPEDVWVPQHVVSRLWKYMYPELTDFDCEEISLELSRLALVERNSEDQTLLLHDLLHDYTREKLADKYVTVHTQLLNAYNSNGYPWYEIKHDGYLYFQLGYHLREADRIEELYHLVTDSQKWLEIKSEACNGDAAFVADLNLLLNLYNDPLSDQDTVRVLKLFSARQIINRRVELFSDLDLTTLTYLGKHQEALNHARLRSDNFERFKGLATIFETLHKLGSANTALIQELQEATSTIPRTDEREQSISKLAKLCSQVGLFSQSQELEQQIGHEPLKLSATLARATSLVQHGNVEEAISIAQAYPEWKFTLFSAIAVELIQDSQNTAAIDQARTLIGDEFYLSHASELDDSTARNLIVVLTYFQEYDQLKKLTSDQAHLKAKYTEHLADVNATDLALELFEDFGDKQIAFADTTYAIVRSLARNHRSGEAITLVNSFDRWRRSEIEYHLVEGLCSSGQYELARKFAGNKARVATLRLLLSYLFSDGITDSAFDLLRVVRQKSKTAGDLRELALLLAKAKEHAESQAVFQDAQIAARIQDQTLEFNEAARQYATILLESGQFYNAWCLSDLIPWQGSRVQVVSAILRQAILLGQYEDVELILEGQSNPGDKEFLLSVAASAFFESGRIEESEEFISKITVSRFRASAWIEFAKVCLVLGDTVDTEKYIQVAGETIMNIPEPWYRAEQHLELAAILRPLDSQQALEALTNAQEAALAIEDPEFFSDIDFREQISRAYLETGRIDEAKSILLSIEHPRLRSMALSKLIAWLIDANIVEQVQPLTEEISDPLLKLNSILLLSGHYVNDSRYDLSRKYFETASALLATVSVISLRNQALISLARYAVVVNRLDDIDDLINSISDSHMQIRAKIKVMTELHVRDRGDWRQVFEEIRTQVLQLENEKIAASTQSEVVNALISLGEGVAAENLIRYVKYTNIRKEASLALSNHLIAEGLAKKALTVLGSVDLDQFLLAISQWKLHLESLSHAVQCIAESINIVSWESDAWKQLANNLSMLKQLQSISNQDEMQTEQIDRLESISSLAVVSLLSRLSKSTNPEVEQRIDRVKQTIKAGFAPYIRNAYSSSGSITSSPRKSTGMQTVKLVITGPSGSGKSTFIQSLSEIEVVSTDSESLDQDSSNVAMDFGRITVTDDLVLYLFSTPGDSKYDFMWEILAEGMLGFIVMVDSSHKDSVLAAYEHLRIFRAYAPTPFVVAANKQDMAGAISPEEIAEHLGIESNDTVLPCVADEPESARKVLLKLIYKILEELGDSSSQSTNDNNAETVSKPTLTPVSTDLVLRVIDGLSDRNLSGEIVKPDWEQYRRKGDIQPEPIHISNSFTVKRVTPKGISKLDAFMQKSWIYQTDNSSVEILADYGILVCETPDDSIQGVIIWYLENVITRIVDLQTLADASSVIMSTLIESVELISHQLQSEVSLIKVTKDTPQPLIDAYMGLGYIETPLAVITVPAWKEAARELVTNEGDKVFLKKLREDRILRPI